MEKIYLNRILQSIETSKGKERFDVLSKELFNKVLSTEELQSLDRKQQLEIMMELEEREKIDSSCYDVQKIARAIQNSRSGIGGSAFTPFQCAFCAEEECWHNTAVPNICRKCAESMARTIVVNQYTLEKKR